MKIAIAVGSWTVGSVLLGLALGRLLGAFAARRRAEEKLFAWLEQLRFQTILRGIQAGRSPEASHIPEPSGSAPAQELGSTGWLSHWAARQRGRIQ
jgi:hypothetical protein